MKLNSRLYVYTHVKSAELLTLLILSGGCGDLHFKTDRYTNSYTGQY